LNDRLTQAISFAQRQGKQLAVLFVDLDDFKKINDSLGHEIGDKLLQSVAGRLIASVCRWDAVSRQGGGCLLRSSTQTTRPSVCEKSSSISHCAASNRAHQPLFNRDIGVSTCPGDGQDALSLMNSADAAMYDAKEHGRNNCQFFRPDMHARIVERQFLEGSLRGAVRRHEFLLHYQPKISPKSGEIAGVEALLCWRYIRKRNSMRL
jgi:diguanylate cyclase